MMVERGRNELKPLHGKPVQGVDMEGDLAQTLLILSKVILGCPLHDSVWEEGVGDEEERPGHGGHSCRCSQRSSMGAGARRVVVR